jgi:Janus kinase 2
VHVCSIEELCFITVRSDGSMEIARKTGIPIYFKFGSILSMFSLVSLLDGYYRLGVKWTFSLSKDLPTPSLERLHSIKCHGPVGYVGLELRFIITLKNSLAYRFVVS